MNLSSFFQEQLQNSAAGFVWAAQLVPLEQHYLAPPRPGWLGSWSLTSHVFHLMYYEQYLTLAQVRECAHLPISYVRGESEDILWQRERRDVERMLAEFQSTRHDVITLLASLDEDVWERPHEETPWGESLNLRWYVTKAYQHTCDHISSVLSLSLFWGCAQDRDQQGQ